LQRTVLRLKRTGSRDCMELCVCGGLTDKQVVGWISQSRILLFRHSFNRGDFFFSLAAEKIGLFATWRGEEHTRLFRAYMYRTSTLSLWQSLTPPLGCLGSAKAPQNLGELSRLVHDDPLQGCLFQPRVRHQKVLRLCYFVNDWYVQLSVCACCWVLQLVVSTMKIEVAHRIHTRTVIPCCCCLST